jgi:hypothetical protein
LPVLHEMTTEQMEEIAARKSGRVLLVGPRDGPLSDVLQEAVKSVGGTVDDRGYGMLPMKKLKPEEQAALEQFQGPVKTVPPRRRHSPQLRKKGSVDEAAHARARDAVGWCVEVGMSAQGAALKTGAALWRVKQILRDMRRRGENTGLAKYGQQRAQADSLSIALKGRSRP